MFATLLVHVWYDGAVPAGTLPPTPDTYASTAPPLGAFSVIDGYGAGAGGVPGTYNTGAPPIGAFSLISGYGAAAGGGFKAAWRRAGSVIGVGVNA